MVYEEQVRQLIQRLEDETVDFKATGYDLSTEDGRLALVKDVVCMANTPRAEASHIVLGVKKHADGSFELRGVGSHPDDALLQSQFTERVYPIPEFHYRVVCLDGVELGILEIPPRRMGPCAPLKDFGGSLRQWQIYFRRGSKNDVATPVDQAAIHRWFSGTFVVSPAAPGTSWDRLLELTGGYTPSITHILVVSPGATELSNLPFVAVVPWTAVFDFDSDSDATGALAAVKDKLSSHRSLHLVTLRDGPAVQTGLATYWIFPMGLRGRADTLSAGSWKQWRQAFGAPLQNHLRALAAASAPKPVVLTVVWRGPVLLLHLQTLLEDAISVFGERLSIVMLSDDPAEVQPLAAKTDAAIVDGPVDQLFAALDTLEAAVAFGEQEVLLPSQSGAPLRLSQPLARWIEEDLGLVHLGMGLTPTPNRDVGSDFLRGAEIDWFELGLHSDVERDLQRKMSRQIESDLRGRRTRRINLFHAPGSGGTTFARRLLWNFHTTFPSAIVRTVTADTVERIFRLASFTDLPVLLLLDGAQISERQLDELSDGLSSRHVPAVLLQVLRRFSAQTPRERSFYLPFELSAAEAERFVAVYSNARPERQPALRAVAEDVGARYRSAFFFGLVAFGSDFLGLEPHVRSRIDGLTQTQKTVICFLAMAHHYSQHPLPAQSFAPLLGLPADRPVDFESMLTPDALDLLVETDADSWRTSHDLIAFEIIQQILTRPGGDRRAWNQLLSTWGADFARFCRGDAPVASDVLLEVARRVFIYRDNSELIGTERSGLNLFSQLIQEIPSKEGALEILRLLVHLYPEEPHFWAHLGRFYSQVLSDWSSALECIERALAINEDDSVLHHMKGMALRAQMYDAADRQAALQDAIALAREASEAFATARQLNPDNEHGYISEVQMLIRLLDYTGRQSSDGLWGYFGSPSADPWLRESLQRAEDLLERIRRNREGQGDSTYELDSRARLDALYGRHDRALQIWDNLLSRPGVYGPPIRRQIVWTYLARRNRSWDTLEPREIDRIVDLLDQNLRDEPDSDANLRLWIQAVRRATMPPSTESVIERVTYWRANVESLEASFYLYSLYALLCIEGSVVARDSAIRFIDESRQKARLRRNRTKSFEWLGVGKGLNRLIHQSQLGDWNRETEFWDGPSRLARMVGRISRIDGPQAGEVELECGLRAFFVPARGAFNRGQSENQLVNFYLGFSYDGLRAWEVRAEE